MEPEERTVAEDFASPVKVQPGVDQATPADWSWRRLDTSQPNKATFHMSHSDTSHVTMDVLRPSDSPPDSSFAITRDIPIVIIDSLDQYWAGEARSRLRLHGLRVPVANDTREGAKRALAADLAAQLRLLLLLSSSREGKLAPQLKENLAHLTQYFAPRSEPQEP
jgi:hypothetical protein